MPTSSITYIRATTRGRAAAGARSVASARPAVCTVCAPAPTSRKARQADTRPAQTCSVVSPLSSTSANGMMARPPNCSSVPVQMKGTRRQPRKLRCRSERRPISARNGATSSGKATISATSHDHTPSSTIITRFSVPTVSTATMPTVTWNSASRSRRDSGSSVLAASANGR